MAGNLYYGDNLGVLREHVRDETVDLVYLDPPFNSNATYNVLFKAPSGQQSRAQIEAFEDTWHWGTEAEAAFLDVLRNPRYGGGAGAGKIGGSDIAAIKSRYHAFFEWTLVTYRLTLDAFCKKSVAIETPQCHPAYAVMA